MLLLMKNLGCTNEKSVCFHFLKQEVQLNSICSEMMNHVPIFLLGGFVQSWLLEPKLPVYNYMAQIQCMVNVR